MPSADLTDFVVTLLHHIVGPRHHRHHCGGRCHHCQVTAPSVSTHPSGGNIGVGPLGTATQTPMTLQPLHDQGCWRGPCPLPPIDRSTGRWSPQTMMPHWEVTVAAHVPSMFGARALTQLHQRSYPHHGAMRGTRREEKDKKTRQRWWLCPCFSTDR
jgi:hypothetical protein